MSQLTLPSSPSHGHAQHPQVRQPQVRTARSDHDVEGHSCGPPSAANSATSEVIGSRALRHVRLERAYGAAAKRGFVADADYSTAEIAIELDLCARSVANMWKRDDLPKPDYYIGRHPRWHGSTLIRWRKLESERVKKARRSL